MKDSMNMIVLRLVIIKSTRKVTFDATMRRDYERGRSYDEYIPSASYDRQQRDQPRERERPSASSTAVGKAIRIKQAHEQA